MKNLEKIISFLKDPNTYWSSKGNLVIENDFEIKPQDFLNYAEKDLQDTYSHNLINTLSNAKRALDCQVDILLIAFGYYNISKNKFWGFPKKIEIIKELGILAPRVLLKVNKTRNLMEHQYVKPTLEQVEDFVDIVALFMASTDKYIYNFPDDLEIENDYLDSFWLKFSNNYEGENLRINVIYKNSENEELIITYKDIGYSELLNLILKIGNKN